MAKRVCNQGSKQPVEELCRVFEIFPGVSVVFSKRRIPKDKPGVFVNAPGVVKSMQLAFEGYWKQ